MSKLIVKGPVQLNGSVSVRGGKNAALPIIIAAGITGQPVKLRMFRQSLRMSTLLLNH